MVKCKLVSFVVNRSKTSEKCVRADFSVCQRGLQVLSVSPLYFSTRNPSIQTAYEILLSHRASRFLRVAIQVD